MRQLIVSPAALADLREIWEFIAADDAAAADRVLAEIGGRLDLLLESPLMGRPRPELAALFSLGALRDLLRGRGRRGARGAGAARGAGHRRAVALTVFGPLRALSTRILSQGH